LIDNVLTAGWVRRFLAGVELHIHRVLEYSWKEIPTTEITE
jgi:hypothetical protein